MRLKKKATVARRIRRMHSPEFKAKIALEVLTGHKTAAQLCQEHDLHANQINDWKQQLISGAKGIFGAPAVKQVDTTAMEAKIGRLTLENAPCPSWLAADALLIEFSSHRAAARRKYADHVRAGVGLPSVWADLSGQIYLGDEKFVAKMQSKLMDSSGDLAASDALDIPLAQRRRPRKALAWFEAQFADRNAALAAAYASGAYKQVELARHFGLHSTTVSRLISQAEKSV